MTTCKKCKKQVKTTIQFDRNGMAYLECNECGHKIDKPDYDDDDDDYYESGFMNDFGDSN